MTTTQSSTPPRNKLSRKFHRDLASGPLSIGVHHRTKRHKHDFIPIDRFIDTELSKLENSTDYHAQRLYRILQQYKSTLPKENESTLWKIVRNIGYFLYCNFLVAPCIPLTWRGIWNLFDRIFPKNDLKMVTICLGIAWIGLAGLQLLVWLTNVIILDVPNRFHPQESVVKQQQRFWSSRKERVKKFARFVCSHVVHQVIYYIGLVIGVLLWKGVWDLASFQVLSGELFQDVLTHVIPLAILCLTGHLADGCGPAPFFSSDEKGRLRVLIGPDLAVETAELFSDILAPNMCDVHSDQESMISINMQRLPRRTTDTSDESSSPVEFDRTCPATIVSFPSTESLLQSHNKKAISLPGEARTTTSTSSSSTTPPHASRTSSEKSRLNSTYNSGTSDTEGVKTRDNPKSAYRTFDRSTTKAQTVPHEASSLRSIIKQNERNTSGTTPPTSASSRNLSPSNKSAAMPIYPPTSKEGLDDTKNVKSSPDLASEERKSVNKPPNT